MALDETLFRITEKTGIVIARFYDWASPALTYGYFDQPPQQSSIPAIRRFTGGGLVEHGEDLTFLLTIPRACELSHQPSRDLYETIHLAIAKALHSVGLEVTLENTETASQNGPCFQTPVPRDVMDPNTNLKIGGGAQRRTRKGIIHQGSLRLPADYRKVESEWIAEWLKQLFGELVEYSEKDRQSAVSAALELEKSRYKTDEWNLSRQELS